MADFLFTAGADIELGCSTPLMEAAQEGHLELVKYLLKASMYHISYYISHHGQVRIGNYFLYFSAKTYVVDTQKNRLNEKVLLSTQNTRLN